MSDLREAKLSWRQGADLNGSEPETFRRHALRESWPNPLTAGFLERVLGVTFADDAIRHVLARKPGRPRHPIRQHATVAETVALIEQAYFEGRADGEAGVDRGHIPTRLFTRVDVTNLLERALRKREALWSEWANSVLAQAQFPNGPMLPGSGRQSVPDLLEDAVVELQLIREEK